MAWMPQQENEQPSQGQKWGLTLLALLLAWECLLPLAQISSMERVDIFLWAFLLFLIAQRVVHQGWLRFSLCVLLVVILLHRAHFALHYSFFDPLWLAQWSNQFITGWSMWWGREGWMGPASFHTFLFLLALWALAVLFRLWSFESGRVFPFIIGAVVVLSTLDSFTSYDASGAILRVFVYGFIALAWLRLARLREQSVGEPPAARGWATMTAVLILVAAVVGWAAPKPAAGWPNPLAWIPSGDDRAGGGVGIRQIGYSRDDSYLGGSLQMNEETAIEALVETPYYWRGESRDLYTGKGWQNTLQPEKQLEFRPQEEIPQTDSKDIDAQLFQDIPTDRNRVRLTQLNNPVLFTSGELKTVTLRYEETIQQQPHHGGFVAEGRMRLREYSLVSEIPRIDEDQLRKARDYGSREIADTYLQLPASLPGRVRQLAQDVTAEEDNPYDQAKAIESYLRQGGGYTYELEDVPLPGREDDFVDQFLFESKQGYCDHFSTSMVVMLRSVGIPARWVKGFTPGDAVPVTDEKQLENHQADELYQVEVKNSNAHSWVEVYFEGFGWIPFEPTPGFSNPTPLEVEQADTDDEAETEEEENDPAAGGPDPRQQELNQDPAQAGEDVTSEQTVTTWWRPWVWGIGLSLAVIGLLFWLWRHRLAWWWLSRQPSTTGSLLRAYGSLLQWLSWYQGPRRPDQTLREYVLEREWPSQPSAELRELTHTYEETRYGKGKMELGERTRTLWKRVMNQFRP
ncbi:transglutaminase TgpA family protein [Desmospora activa]|uniref:Uncharacterized protein DUF4129 n=1 Tax=Desmospora activa DSM 45169 TaxID=1121389 RepID=A0A2T4Z0D6_9BACL|nr:transglutaminaseTgpA domain-containing protein [Desmospora activa]PTM53207.1 uncharacterized protein DUF4129 [Desmospora activa DSM 45169]